MRGWARQPFIGLYLYEGGGYELCGGRVSSGRPGDGGDRGRVKGWSRASRRRMRSYLVKHGPPAGWKAWGVTLTIPGATIPTRAEVRAMWAAFSQEIRRRGWAMVWRLELQVTRSMPHWHCLLITPDGEDRASVSRWIWHKWAAMVDRLPDHPEHTVLQLPGGWYRHSYMGGSYVSSVAEFQRSRIRGTGNRMIAVEGGGDRGDVAVWKRYLQDHATKVKAEQIADGWGRHWGIVGRERFVEIKGRAINMTARVREYVRILRALRRMWRRRVHDDRCPFGSRLGRPPRRGRIGTGVAAVFGRVETVERLVAWAASEGV